MIDSTFTFQHCPEVLVRPPKEWQSYLLLLFHWSSSYLWALWAKSVWCCREDGILKEKLKVSNDNHLHSFTSWDPLKRRTHSLPMVSSSSYSPPPHPNPPTPTFSLPHFLLPIFVSPLHSLKKKNQSTERLDLQMSGQETGNKGSQSQRGSRYNYCN